MLKVSRFKKSYQFYFWSSIVVVLVLISAIIIASFLPHVEKSVAQRILETLISLDGVLFGFTAVMAGLFLGKFNKLSKTTIKNCLFFAMLSFWSYIILIVFAFIIIGFQENFSWPPLFTPIILTIFGSICSSIYLILILIDEIFPAENEIAK